MQVDWELAGRIARTAAGAAPPSAVPDGLDERAVAAREQVVEVTGLVPSVPLPVVEWVDRGGWIDANLRTMRSTLGPLVERGGGPAALQAAAGAVVAAEGGGVLGPFSRRGPRPDEPRPARPPPAPPAPARRPHP